MKDRSFSFAEALYGLVGRFIGIETGREKPNHLSFVAAEALNKRAVESGVSTGLQIGIRR
jgi:hypothetical protein